MLAACASQGTAPAEPADPDISSPAAAYVRTSPWGDGDTAGLRGTLRLVDGCLVVERDDLAEPAHRTVVPIFPTDFVWDPAAQSLEAFGFTFTVGERVLLGGGFRMDTSVADHLPEGCPAGDVFQVSSA
jgi:hypothetical protein